MCSHSWICVVRSWPWDADWLPKHISWEGVSSKKKKAPLLPKRGLLQWVLKKVSLSVTHNNCALLKTLFHSVFSKRQQLQKKGCKLHRNRKFTKHSGLLLFKMQKGVFNPSLFVILSEKRLIRLTFLRHVMRAIWSVRPKCSHKCVSLTENSLKPVQILKHTTKISAEQTTMRTKWFKHIAI